MSETRELIVIAEDSPPNRKILSHLLEKLGFTVRAFENGEDAWQALSTGDCQQAIAVISDIMMPKMDGIQLLRQVRGHEPIAKIPVVLVTAISEQEYITQAKALDVNGYILKPVTFQRVMNKLEELFPDKTFSKLAG